MVIQFEPTGTSVNYPDSVTGYNASTIPVTLPILSSNFGGTVTNANDTPPGSFRAFGATNGKGILVWKTVSNAMHDSWQLDDSTAVDTALNDTIPAALAANETFLILKSDGTAGS